MYEAKQNKDTISRTISPIQKRTKSRIKTNIQNEFLKSRPAIEKIMQRHIAAGSIFNCV